MELNYDMSRAPKDRRTLAVRSDGKAAIVHWDENRYRKTPRPYWEDDRAYLGKKWCRNNPPVAWAELPTLNLNQNPEPEHGI